jgi:hypothetical protein
MGMRGSFTDQTVTSAIADQGNPGSSAADGSEDEQPTDPVTERLVQSLKVSV